MGCMPNMVAVPCCAFLTDAGDESLKACAPFSLQLTQKSVLCGSLPKCGPAVALSSVTGVVSTQR